MKKLLLFITYSLLYTAYGFSQGNLQFSRVVLVTDVMQTVPTGKVWKIESIAINAGTPTQAYGSLDITGSGTCAITDNSNAYFEINGIKRACVGMENSAGAGTVPASSCFPFWLPADATLKTLCPSALLSILEFNICERECN